MPPETLALAEQIGRAIGAEIAVALRAPPPGLLPQGELAAALRVSPKTVKRLVRLGMPERRVGGLSRYDLDEVKAWLREREGAEVAVEPAPRRLGRRSRGT